jgi:hypothetical protein
LQPCDDEVKLNPPLDQHVVADVKSRVSELLNLLAVDLEGICVSLFLFPIA